MPAEKLFTISVSRGFCKMRLKQIVLFLSLLILMPAVGASAAGREAIDQVLNKPVLERRDKEIIDSFISKAVNDLLYANDLSDTASLRTAILRRRSTQGEYAKQFSDSLYKYLPDAFTQASKLQPQERQNIILINLLVLTDELAENRLRELAAGQLNAESMAVRYQAVRCLNNPEMLKQLNSGQNSDTKLAQVLTDKMSKIVESSAPEVIALIAQFAAGLNSPQAVQLLLQVADARIKQYADWTVQTELVDSTILQMLDSKISSIGDRGQGTGVQAYTLNPIPYTPKEALAERFAQLYSYVIQRYVKGASLLDNQQRQYLLTVIIQTEQKCLSRLLGQQQTKLKQAIEKKDFQALMAEHNRLLGSGSSRGELPAKLGFTYNGQTSPTILPDPPINN